MSEFKPLGRRVSYALLAAGAVAAALGLGWALGKLRTSQFASESPFAPAPAGRGALLFQANCATCHGAEGRADSPTAATLHPPPRDFTARPWRFERTPASIRKVILDGIAGTGMPGSRATLASEDVDLLVEHVLKLAMARPISEHQPTDEERLLSEAGFLDLCGTAAPPLTVADVQGGAVKLSSLKGRLVLLHFWGTTCVHCLKEMPHLHELEARLGDRPFTILHVCADADGAAQEQVDAVVPGVRVLVDKTGIGLARFEVQSLPTTWLIGANGKALGRSRGTIDWRSPAIRRLLDHYLPPHE